VRATSASRGRSHGRPRCARKRLISAARSASHPLPFHRPYMRLYSRYERCPYMYGLIMINTASAISYSAECRCKFAADPVYSFEHRGHDAISVTPHFSPSHSTVSTTSLPFATAVVELEASVFEPAQKPRHWQEIGVPQ